jgi:hypothetical protein
VVSQYIGGKRFSKIYGVDSGIFSFQKKKMASKKAIIWKIIP